MYEEIKVKICFKCNSEGTFKKITDEICNNCNKKFEHDRQKSHCKDCNKKRSRCMWSC